MIKSICSVFLQNSPLYCKIIFDVFYQKITKILKLKDLCTGKTTPIHAVYLITKKNTHSTAPENFDQSGRFLVGGPGQIFTQRLPYDWILKY